MQDMLTNHNEVIVLVLTMYQPEIIEGFRLETGPSLSVHVYCRPFICMEVIINLVNGFNDMGN